jgi:zinc transporter ZupT
MGTSQSSAGATTGIILGSVILAPFTAGALIAYGSAAAAAGMATTGIHLAAGNNAKGSKGDEDFIAGVTSGISTIVPLAIPEIKNKK